MYLFVAHKEVLVESASQIICFLKHQTMLLNKQTPHGINRSNRISSLNTVIWDKKKCPTVKHS